MYYHRIPLPADDANCDEMSDCFGRQRHSSHRQDMNGVGSFMNPSRTLFVGNLTRSKYESPKALEDAVWKHFSEWGELENVNVVHRLSIAFPRYRLRTSAGKLYDFVFSTAR
jgi:RNA recognition motif-containing protein